MKGQIIAVVIVAIVGFGILLTGLYWSEKHPQVHVERINDNGED